MEKLSRYREIVRRLVEEYASHKPSIGEVDSYAMIDTDRDHYIAMQSGWAGRYRVHGAFLHIDMINNKVWIQFNGTDQPIAEELVAAGIPREDIVLGFHPEELRKHTVFAVN